MHELSIMDSTLRIAIQHAEAQQATRIHRITMRIGELSGVAMDALTFAFEVLSNDTPASGAELEIERVPARCRCTGCGTEFTPEGPIFTCPDCGELSATIVQGREMELVSMEVS